MTFNGIDFKTLGLVPQFVHGVLDMPARKGETEYDWGDVTEPLVDAEDIFFGYRKITVDALFDERLGVTWKDASNQLSSITDSQILSTDYGDYLVRLDELKVAKSYKGGKTLKIHFLELNPDLSGGLPTTTGETSIRIDGYDLFTQFGLLIERTVMYEIAALKSSKQTAFQNNVLSVYREPQVLNVKLNGIYASKANMTSKINQLNKLLAKEGLRHFIYHGEGFYCYVDEGFRVDIKRNRVEITLKLKVSVMYNFDEIVQAVVNQVNIQTNPQSDLSITDNTDPAYIHGQDTFIAQDSERLGNELPAFYAQDADLLELRTFDFAARLETATTDI